MNTHCLFIYQLVGCDNRAHFELLDARRRPENLVCAPKHYAIWACVGSCRDSQANIFNTNYAKGLGTITSERILGIPISLITLESLVKCALCALNKAQSPFTVAFANPHSLVISRCDEAFRKALETTSIVAPDGTGIIVASRLCGGRLETRVTGSDFFAALSQAMNIQGGKRCFFLGSSQETLAKLQARFERLYPSITFAGSYSPPFKDTFSAVENQEMISAINAAHPDVLWVGMTAPKQEKWIHQNVPSLNVKVIGAIGAVFDYFAGSVRRPGKAWRACGLEWFPRLLQEPRRLWRRNLLSSPMFLYLTAKERLQLTIRRPHSAG